MKLVQIGAILVLLFGSMQGAQKVHYTLPVADQLTQKTVISLVAIGATSYGLYTFGMRCFHIMRFVDACKRGDYAYIEERLKRDPQLLSKDPYHQALHWAILLNRTSVARLLLASGIDIQVRDHRGQRAEYYARKFGQHELLAAFEERKQSFVNAKAINKKNEERKSNESTTNSYDNSITYMQHCTYYARVICTQKSNGNCSSRCNNVCALSCGTYDKKSIYYRTI